MGRRWVTILLTGVLAALAAVPASAKEGVEATLVSPIPTDASPGETITVSWTLATEENGERTPFGAEGIYVKLLSAAGGKPTTGAATGSADGGYAATVRVPEGGIGGIKVGLVGWASDANGTRRSDVFFPVTNWPTGTGSATPAAGPAPSPPAEDGRPALWIGGALLALVLAVGTAGVVVQRRRHAPSTG
jgi:hypothetical protein